MKTEMAMMDNGNYERIISPIQHKCGSQDLNLVCVEYGWERGKLILWFEEGDPYEDGISYKTDVMYCPFCGYKPEEIKTK